MVPRQQRHQVQKGIDGTKFECAAGDKCCGGACVGEHDVCCENVNGDSFPCQGEGGGCCGNACYASGSKCCKPKGPKSAWYPVSKDTECRKASTQCTNRKRRGRCRQVCRAPPCMHPSNLVLRFNDALVPASFENDCVRRCASHCSEVTRDRLEEIEEKEFSFKVVS